MSMMDAPTKKRKAVNPVRGPKVFHIILRRGKLAPVLCAVRLDTTAEMALKHYKEDTPLVPAGRVKSYPVPVKYEAVKPGSWKS